LRRRKTEAGAINIRIHPHPSHHYYTNLLSDAVNLKKYFRSRGDQHLLISYLGKPKNVGNQIEIRGIIARFTEIDDSQPWFNTITNDEARKNDILSISIPPNLKPNYQPFSFVFFPKKHLLVFEKHTAKSSISHGVVKGFFSRLFDSEEIKNKYGEVNVDVISDMRGLDEIWAINKLKHLDILIKRPNPDDFSEAERLILEKLESQRVNKVEQRLTAINGESIEASEETRTLAKVAVNNGYVHGDGKNAEGEAVDLKTTNFPKTERLYYDHSDEVGPLQAFMQLARKFL